MDEKYIKAKSNKRGKIPRYWRDSVKAWDSGERISYTIADLDSWYYLRSVPRWLDWAIPWGGLRLGRYLLVGGDPARAFGAGYLHVDTWRKHGCNN